MEKGFLLLKYNKMLTFFLPIKGLWGFLDFLPYFENLRYSSIHYISIDSIFNFAGELRGHCAECIV